LNTTITKDCEIVITKDFKKKLLLLSLIWATIRWLRIRPS